MSLILETKRLKMRAFQEKDIHDFAEYRSDPEVAKYQSWDAPYSMEEAVQLVDAMITSRPGTTGEWYAFAIELKADGKLIGDCAFHILAEDGQQAEIGFTLARRYQGQGYATEAVIRLMDYLFGELCLHRVRASCDIENLASCKLLERIGMRREGHFVENIWFKGKWGSEYMYGRLQHEWAKSSTSLLRR